MSARGPSWFKREAQILVILTLSPLVVGLVAGLFGVLLYSRVHQPDYEMDIHIAATDLGSQLKKFVSAPGQPFLVITVDDNPHFVQFSHSGDRAVMDFPLITDDQKSRADSIRGFAAKNGLQVELTSGSDGAQFIDMDVPLDALLLEKLVRDAFATAFGVTKLDRLHLQADPGWEQ